jgi:hypothetical protein
MSDYYKLDKDGRIVSPPVIINCVDDDAALIVAQQYVDGLAIELWADARRVAFIPSDEK